MDSPYTQFIILKKNIIFFSDFILDLNYFQIISGTVVGTDLPGQVLSLPSELVVCNLSDTEVVQEEIIDTD